MPNFARTAILLAGLTGLFLAVGYMLGGPVGMGLALVFALGMNAFAWWNSDRMLLSMYGAEEADRQGAEICGDPLALASALERLERGAARIDNHAAERNPATAHLFIVNPLHAHRADKLFSTHPSTANRVRALRELARAQRPRPARQAGSAPTGASWMQGPRRKGPGGSGGARAALASTCSPPSFWKAAGWKMPVPTGKARRCAPSRADSPRRPCAGRASSTRFWTASSRGPCPAGRNGPGCC